MFRIQEGQCGLCRYFAASPDAEEQRLQIHQQRQAPENFVGQCRHPQHASLHLRVTAISGCDGFELVPELQAAAR